MSSRVASQKGFALPTVVIATVVLMMVLVTSVSAVVSSRVALDSQFQDQLARDATESGIARAAECLAAYNYDATWTSATLLRPNTNCTGGSACTTLAKCFVAYTSQYRTTYTVSPPVDNGTGVQEFTVTAVVALLRGSNGTVSSSFTRTTMAQVGAQVTNSGIVFGYTLVGGGGAFYATVGRDGTMRAAGYNEFGQLGNGTTSDTLSPALFNAPTTNPIVAGFSNFLSAGTSMFAIDSTGAVFGAGANDRGQIGAGTVSASVSTPLPVQIPGSKPISAVVVGSATNYFLATDGNLYAAGECDSGRLGNNYTISGCVDRSTPVRVNLPTPNPSDLNTMPTTNIVSDRDTVYVRMQGGRIYGWGANDYGQLGVADYQDKSNPVQIGTYGNTGLPKASHIQNDGGTIYIVGSNGRMNSIGLNNYGSHGNRTVSLFNYATKRCINNTGGDGINLAYAVCNGSSAQRFEYRSDSTLYNAATNKCINNTSSDGVRLGLATCSTSTAQVFAWTPQNSELKNPATGKCIENLNGDGVSLRLATCSTAGAQDVDMTATWMSPFNLSATYGSIISADADERQVSVVTSSGQVWSAGVNTSGMFGDGTAQRYQPDPIKFQLPAGVYAASVATASVNSQWSTQYQNVFVVTTTGKVYGAGSNVFGQLGNGATATTQTTPVLMSVINGTTVAAKDIKAGMGTAVIYTSSGIVYTVGNNSNGQIGDGTTTNRSTPYFSRLINRSEPTQY